MGLWYQKMAAQTGNRITAPELEQFVIDKVQLTGVTLGAGVIGMNDSPQK